MESKLNIYGLAGVPGRGRGRFMDGNGREQFGRPTSRKPIIKRRPKTRQVTRKLVKTTGGFKPAKVTTLRLDYGRINSQAKGKAAAEAKNAKKRADLKALQAGIARARTKKLADARAKAKRIADARAKAAAIDELKRDTGGFKPSKPIIQTVVPDNVPMNLSTETTETEEKQTFISKNKYAIGVAGLVTAGLLFFRKKDDKKKT
ncbi:hypothetical protein [Tenacibaculum finnmarkense]|uniref:hypothetical protein n=1 Tax=Tenacibaculum finnmarkense TaxID=2781243 RepID=UPI001EFB5C38|nr:hypothetical protein [Tenacibaculum finnmarkense]MCG8236882.1 hypothetical protein [Tenacibaculum finnmarkense genomovar ulcerans]MCG8831396.1 hypothetical protein [Tenacibaculum finnmarkense]